MVSVDTETKYISNMVFIEKFKEANKKKQWFKLWELRKVIIPTLFLFWTIPDDHGSFVWHKCNISSMIMSPEKPKAAVYQEFIYLG